ncbi:ABC transporter substrate-binding protein [Goodfellowiella coeruleoviolacea]|uniref:Iron complex transport system substrate-binding protein n=1 Tax=Goodfellowiella coeruleoviolacea TaxID=334858 RepID=A0AAE3KED6_9PSEU|nr:ABC transporter substrate-binding protein [Goodfellowiella coeruleoviolacea]MCP2163249.1 iron complex transport system substrate-binding protein [Goodfellowiella coeruleoviolacea]
MGPRLELTRRGFLLSAAAVGLTACGVDTDTAADPASGQTHRVATDLGEVDVPQHPQRVVAADFYPAFILADLGITPVGVCEYTEELVPPDYRSLLDVHTIGPNGQPNVQEIATLAPDLVVSMGYVSGRSKMQPVYDQMKAVAPTVVLLSSSQAKFWRECADRLAPIVGRDAEGQRLREDYAARTAELRQRHAAALASTRWAYVSQGNNTGTWTLNFAGSALGGVLADAGVQFGSAAAGQTANGQQYSYEQLNVLNDCDVIVYPVTYTGQPRQPVQDVLNQSTFQELPAVRAGRLHPIPNYGVASYRIATAALGDIDKILQGLA